MLINIFLEFKIGITSYVIRYIAFQITNPTILAGRKCIGEIFADRSMRIIVYVALIFEIVCMLADDI